MSSNDKKYNMSIVSLKRSSLNSTLPSVLPRPHDVTEADMSKTSTSVNRKRRLAHTPKFPVDDYFIHRSSTGAASVELPAKTSTSCGNVVESGTVKQLQPQSSHNPRCPLKMAIKRTGNGFYKVVKSTVTSVEDASGSKLTSSSSGLNSSGVAQKPSLKSKTPKELSLPTSAGCKKRLSSPGSLPAKKSKAQTTSTLHGSTLFAKQIPRVALHSVKNRN